MIQKKDSFSYSDIEFGKFKLVPPFSVWSYVDFKPTIHKLLRGEKISIKTDITKETERYAVKFRKIGIRKLKDSI